MLCWRQYLKKSFVFDFSFRFFYLFCQISCAHHILCSLFNLSDHWASVTDIKRLNSCPKRKRVVYQNHKKGFKFTCKLNNPHPDIHLHWERFLYLLCGWRGCERHIEGKGIERIYSTRSKIAEASPRKTWWKLFMNERVTFGTSNNQSIMYWFLEKTPPKTMKTVLQCTIGSNRNEAFQVKYAEPVI